MTLLRKLVGHERGLGQTSCAILDCSLGKASWRGVSELTTLDIVACWWKTSGVFEYGFSWVILTYLLVTVLI